MIAILNACQNPDTFNVYQAHQHFANLVNLNASRWLDDAVMSSIYVTQGTTQ